MAQLRKTIRLNPLASFQHVSPSGGWALRREEVFTIQNADDIRAQITANGPTEMPIALEDGRVLRTDKEILDYMDEGDRAADFFDLCGRGPS